MRKINEHVTFRIGNLQGLEKEDPPLETQDKNQRKSRDTT